MDVDRPGQRLQADRFVAGRWSRRRVREPTGQKGHELKYSPSECTGTRKRRVEGNPDPAQVSTSYVERQNLTMRMQMRRFTRLTNAFSKKFENHMHMVALYTVWYNFIRIHKTLRVTPAMAAGLSDTLWDMEDLVRIMDERAPKPGRPKTYNKITSVRLKIE